MKNKNRVFVEPGMLIFIACVVIAIVVSLTNINTVLKIVIIIIPFIFLAIRQLGYYHLSRAKENIKRNQNDKAKIHLTKALRHSLSSYKKLEIERILFSIGEYEKAYEIAECLKDDDNSEIRSTALCDFALIKWKMGNVDEATEILESLLDNNPSDNILRLNLSTLYLEKGRINDAVELLKDVDKDSSFGLIDNKVECCILLGEWKEAEVLSDILFPTDCFPKFPEAFLHRAVIKLHNGKIEDAILLLEKAKSLSFSQFSL
ncbi:MAG: tetratricopeptide repeat protein, partial [Candidatus Ornithospirochaeta sp.]